MNDMADRVVVITGGGGHLGRAMAVGLARRGAAVIICGRSSERLSEAAAWIRAECPDGNLETIAVDVAEPRGIDLLLRQALQFGGRVDGWVNNAASSAAELLGKVSVEGLQRTFMNSISQTILATQKVAEVMAPSGRGSIVNVASMYGMVSPQPGLYAEHPQFHNPPAYGAAKAGIIQFTRYAACHYGTAGVRVNAVSPGPFPKAAVRGVGGFAAELEARVPLGRVGEAHEIVGPVAFLLSDDASYVTGHNLVVDGGWTAW